MKAKDFLKSACFDARPMVDHDTGNRGGLSSD